MIENDRDDGWAILTPGVVLFETKIGSLEKPIPHPILDDAEKITRIIANPLYDRLTVSRAAQIRPKSLLTRSKESKPITPSRPATREVTFTQPLPTARKSPEIRPTSRSSSRSHQTPPFRLPTTFTFPRRPPTASSTRSRLTTARSSRPTSSSTLPSADERRPIADGTIRYVSSRHGFEVQKYSSQNWLTVDVFSKDACQAQEKPFREMLEKKRQYERLSKSIYSSDYYRKRWYEVMQCYRSDLGNHQEWAQQNYQLLCLKKLYTQAMSREAYDKYLDAEDLRRKRAERAFEEWKEDKEAEKEPPEPMPPRNLNLLDSMNDSFTIPTANSIEDMNTTVIDTSQGISISTDPTNSDQSQYQPTILPRKTSSQDKGLYMYDRERWSLQAMLKRVVGLSQPLPPPPKLATRKPVSTATTNTDSGFVSA